MVNLCINEVFGSEKIIKKMNDIFLIDGEINKDLIEKEYFHDEFRYWEDSISFYEDSFTFDSAWDTPYNLWVEIAKRNPEEKILVLFIQMTKEVCMDLKEMKKYILVNIIKEIMKKYLIGCIVR